MKKTLTLICLLTLFSLKGVFGQTQWADITSTLGGITSTTNMSRPYIFDFNNDNYPDILVPVLTSVVSPYSKFWRLYKNNGDYTFLDVTISYGLPTDLSTTIGFIDYNGDGFKDIYCVTTNGLKIFKNNNGASFTDISSVLGIPSSFFTTGEITSPLRVFDYDLDGDEDILYTRTIGGANTLTAIVNNGSIFSTKINILNSIPGGITGVNFSFFDFDNDGDFDLIFDATTTSQFSNGTTNLYRNDGNGYTNITNTSGLANGLPGDISTIDINQDGNLDIIKGGSDCCTSPLYRVFIGNGNGNFIDQTATYTISSGGYKGLPTLNDFDNDGDFDFSWSYYTSTGTAPFRLYANNGLNSFNETASSYGLNLGVTSGGVPIDDLGYGIWVDLDKDGDLDIILNREGTGSTSLTGNVWVKKNPIQGNFLNIKLKGCGINKSGIGAKIKLIVGNNTKWLYYGNSPDGNTSNGTDIFHFGLGNNTLISSITVYWPNKTTTTLNNVTANQFLTIGGGSAGASPAPTGNASQTFNTGAPVANLTATGANIKWYATATGGTELASTAILVNGTTYYASQTVNGCESSARLAVTVSLNNPSTEQPTSVTIGSQVWTNKNLDIATYRDGTIIPHVTDPAQWANLTTGAWCYYNNDPVLGVIYGRLYNWYAVAGIWDEASKTDLSKRKQLAPKGWHVPTDSEWKTLTTFIGGVAAGGKMKETGTTHWNTPNTAADNSSGFTGLPGGGRSSSDGSFIFIGDGGYWWSSLQYSNGYVWNRTLYNNNSYLGSTSGPINSALSVRFLMDSTLTTTAPTGNTPQTFCSGATVASLTATGTNIKWYAASTGGTALANTTVLLNGTTYYATQTVNSVESTDRLAVTVSIAKISTIASLTNVALGSNASFTGSISGSATFQWQTNSNDIGWINLPNNTTYSGVTSNKLNINNIKVSNHMQEFRLIANAGSCIDTSNVVTMSVNYTLPVELVSFNATLKQNQVNLNWETSSELNNNYFTIAKSIDGKSFTQLTTLASKGDGGTYSALDTNPFSGITYYQLSQTDKDGKTKELGIKAVNFSLANTQKVVIYPNPTQNEVKVSFEKDFYTTAKLIDLQGKILQKKSISINDAELVFDLKALDAGNYLIKLDGKGMNVQKVVKE